MVIVPVYTTKKDVTINISDKNKEGLLFCSLFPQFYFILKTTKLIGDHISPGAGKGVTCFGTVGMP